MQKSTWHDRLEMIVELEIAPAQGGRYRRPYVAVWVEDAKEFPLRTIALWVNMQRPGPRWIRDLRRWFRGDAARKSVEKSEIVATVSSPTRQPGRYTVSWDGLDNGKKPVPTGEYTVCIEAVRDHGTYQLIRKTVTLGDRPFRVDLGGNPEIRSATLEYRKRG